MQLRWNEQKQDVQLQIGSDFLIPEMQIRHEVGPVPRLRLATRTSLVRIPTVDELLASRPYD
jgi:hypothetical protein